jgi:preprotein translocase subunit SecY
MKKIINRAKAPTPKFFKVLRNVGLALAAVGGTVLTALIVLPTIVTVIGSYLTLTGGVLSAVSQLTTTDDKQ